MGFQRRHWWETWKCSECGKTRHDVDVVDARGRKRKKPAVYNARQRTCSPECARERKSRKQRARREAKR